MRALPLLFDILGDLDLLPLLFDLFEPPDFFLVRDLLLDLDLLAAGELLLVLEWLEVLMAELSSSALDEER